MERIPIDKLISYFLFYPRYIVYFIPILFYVKFVQELIIQAFYFFLQFCLDREN